jgi:hypothetical protein
MENSDTVCLILANEINCYLYRLSDGFGEHMYTVESCITDTRLSLLVYDLALATSDGKLGPHIEVEPDGRWSLHLWQSDEEGHDCVASGGFEDILEGVAHLYRITSSMPVV